MTRDAASPSTSAAPTASALAHASCAEERIELGHRLIHGALQRAVRHMSHDAALAWSSAACPRVEVA